MTRFNHKKAFQKQKQLLKNSTLLNQLGIHNTQLTESVNQLKMILVYEEKNNGDGYRFGSNPIFGDKKQVLSGISNKTNQSQNSLVNLNINNLRIQMAFQTKRDLLQLQEKVYNGLLNTKSLPQFVYSNQKSHLRSRNLKNGTSTEKPENSLSYMNSSNCIKYIQATNNGPIKWNHIKQLFIATQLSEWNGLINNKRTGKQFYISLITFFWNSFY